MRERGGRKDDDDCTRDASATEVRGTLKGVGNRSKAGVEFLRGGPH